MAQLIPDDEFSALVADASVLIAASRSVAIQRTLMPPGADARAVALNQEAQTFNIAFMALVSASGLDEAAMFVAIGAATGALLAQAIGSHAELLKVSREQMKATYDEVVETTRPKGNA